MPVRYEQLRAERKQGIHASPLGLKIYTRPQIGPKILLEPRFNSVFHVTLGQSRLQSLIYRLSILHQMSLLGEFVFKGQRASSHYQTELGQRASMRTDIGQRKEFLLSSPPQ